ncbi:uroporphyrinogen-III C-methyltransferase [Zymobacter palmae]|uniref:Uncharacterized enzyme of heme biosynthesis n=1 Tax=Zymobacter palmae TaxID=33074 RepID=A0A348HHR3_9GAMM|nr:uroporphyrinogen-III C-methyltransferase [Zymobacter palmae]BBG31165.1 uncharacterized enzyme of heme biosynthesis [Zymobacter palmae]
MTRQHDSGKDDEVKHDVSDTPSEETTVEAVPHDVADNDVADTVSARDDVRTRRQPPWVWGAGIVALLLLGGLGWSFYQISTTQGQLEQLGSELSALKKNSLAQSALDQAVSPLQAQFQGVDERISAVQKRLDDHRTADGRYVEIDYQLRMALQRLALNRDIRGTLELLKSADQRITELNDPVFLPVRESIQSAMAALNNVSAPDVDGLYLQLAAESHALDGLSMSQSLASMTPEHQQAEQAAADAPQSSWWKRQLSRVGHEMKELVVVRYNDQALNELLMPEQESAIREHLRMTFSEAQMGLLNQSPTVYTHALQSATETLQRYFPQDDARVKGVIDRINALSQQSIRPDLPEVTGVLQQWQQAVERRHAQQQPGA